MDLHHHPTALLVCCALSATLSLGSCAYFKGKEEKRTELAANQQQLVYQEARRLLERARYSDSILRLQALLSNFPSGPYAEQAQLDLAYAQYRIFNLTEAAASVDYFLSLYPDHNQRDYALYLRGLSSFSDRSGLLLRWLPIDRSQRDMKDARTAFDFFSTLLNEYPESELAENTRARTRSLRNLLARHEMQVANYYLKRHAWLAAAKRGQFIIEHYPHSPAVADALATISYAYDRLGLNTMAHDAAKGLALNYPDYPGLNSDDGQVRPLKNRMQVWLSYVGIMPLPAPRFDSRGLAETL